MINFLVLHKNAFLNPFSVLNIGCLTYKKSEQIDTALRISP